MSLMDCSVYIRGDDIEYWRGFRPLCDGVADDADVYMTGRTRRGWVVEWVYDVHVP